MFPCLPPLPSSIDNVDGGSPLHKVSPVSCWRALPVLLSVHALSGREESCFPKAADPALIGMLESADLGASREWGGGDFWALESKEKGGGGETDNNENAYWLTELLLLLQYYSTTDKLACLYAFHPHSRELRRRQRAVCVRGRRLVGGGHGETDEKLLPF